MHEYKPDECAFCGAETWCERRSDGRPQCRACKVTLFFERTLYAPIGYTLLPWQRKVLRDLYGTVRTEDGRRQYEQAYISVAKKNGKSFLVGGLPLYHLLLEDEMKPEAYGAASAKEQAGIVFSAAAALVRGNQKLKDRLRVLDGTKRIVRRDGHGYYRVVSADGDVQDGVEPSLLIRDELHRWKTQKAITLSDVLVKGMISRSESLDVAITTAGAQYESDLWFGEYEVARKILDGSLKSDRRYAAIWQADSKRIQDEPEYWKSREARVVANPSHEDLGGFLKDDKIKAEMDKAIINPAEYTKYLRYHLNVPLTSIGEPVIDMRQWAECGGGVDLRTWPEYDAELLIRKWGLIDRPCYIGVDASWTTDMSAVSALFPPVGDEARWSLLVFVWLPQAKLAELERKVRVPLMDWARRGFITATPGNAVDLSSMVERIKWCNEMFDVREVCYDPYNFRHQAMALNEEGFSVVEVRQGYRSLSPATKNLLQLYPDGALRHGNNPVLNWCAGCMRLQSDHKDNVQPTKPERGKTASRIDAISATVTAMARAMEVEQYSDPNFVLV